MRRGLGGTGTLTANMAGYAPLNNPTFTGSVNASGLFVVGTPGAFASAVGLYEEETPTHLKATDGSDGAGVVDSGPMLNYQRFADMSGSVDGSSRGNLGTFLFSTMVQASTTTRQDLYCLVGAVVASNTTAASAGRHGAVAVAGRAANLPGNAKTDLWGGLFLTNNISSTCQGFGVEVDLINSTGATAPTVTPGVAVDGAMVGLQIGGLVAGSGSLRNSAAVVVLAGSSSAAFNVGFVFGPNSLYQYGVDLKPAGTGGAGSYLPIRLANATYIGARNAADGADVQLIGLDASNLLLLYGGAILANSSGVLQANGAMISPYYVVGANQVVGPRATAVADATNATDVITQLNALLARLRTHGLIAT